MPLTRILAGAITDANVTTPKLADAGVTTVKLADVNVTTSKIANAGVTSPKLAQNLSISLTRVLEEASISTTALVQMPHTLLILQRRLAKQHQLRLL